MIKKQEDIILEILNSDKFDKETFKELNERCFYYDTKYHIEGVAEILRRQYMDLDIENIFANNEKDKIIDFLNRLIHSKLSYDKGYKNQYDSITMEELEEFKMFVTQTKELSREELSKTAPLLTTRTYLDMCRTVYDATFEWKYPSDISTSYLFCNARQFRFEHEYNNGILGTDWDSPEQFSSSFWSSYHNEEMRFGGPKLYIQNKNNVDSIFQIYRQWIGYMSIEKSANIEFMSETIKMYNALRKKQYPIYFLDYNELYLITQKANLSLDEKIKFNILKNN